MSRFSFTVPLERMTNPGIKDQAKLDEDGDLLLTRKNQHLLLLGNVLLGDTYIRVCGALQPVVNF